MGSEKPCTKCGLSKLLEYFPRQSKSRDGRSSHCKDCHNKQCASTRADYFEKVAKRAKKKANCTDCGEFRVVLRAGRCSPCRYKKEGSPQKKFGYFLKYEYGLTVADYEDMIESQAGLCANCTKPMRPRAGSYMSGQGRRDLTCVDHDHATGKVRGLICHECNVGLGHFERHSLFVQDITAYLKAAS